MKWLVTHPVRATLIGLPLQMCELSWFYWPRGLELLLADPAVL